MRKRKVLWLIVLPVLFFLTLGGYEGYKDVFYLVDLGSGLNKVNLLNYRELPRLIGSLPGTEKLILPENYSRLAGNDKIKKIQSSKGQIMFDLYFAEPETDDDAEKRSATITFKPSKPLDLSDTVLFTTVLPSSNIIGKGHQQSRIQLELTDVNNKKMRGPKMPLSGNNERTYLVLRPTVTEPIPLGSVYGDFDPRQVSQVTLRFIVARYPDGISKFPVRGKLFLDNVYVINNLEPIVSFFGQPSQKRITADNTGLLYKFRKITWSKERPEFFVGLNYPWHNYGWDIGKNPYGNPANSGWSSREAKLRDDLSFLKSIGINLVRIYLFFDLRTGLHFTDGQLTGFDAYVRKDIETVFRVAGEVGMKIIPVLFDFGIADGLGPNTGEHPELLFSDEKYNFLVNLMLPILKDMERWNNMYGKPVFALELMNEPENMIALIIPKYFQSLKIWFQDLANIIHNETSFRVTLGSHSIVDMQKWWRDVDIDIWQFHYYKYMQYEHEKTPLTLRRNEIPASGIMFAGEFQPYEISANISAVKDNGYDGILFWNWNTDDGFKLTPEQIKELAEWIETNKTKEVN